MSTALNIGILDYGGGNLRSVINAFRAIDQVAQLVNHPEQFADLDILVFPGQGSFGDSVKQLKNTGLWEPLQQWLKAERPYIGICLGYQLLFESSEESPGVEGLKLFKGEVRRFKAQTDLKIPHMGWNQIHFKQPKHPIWHGLTEGQDFYFVHSFYPHTDEEQVVACETDYTTRFASGVMSKNLFAVQFHPEKSQKAGLQLLANIVYWLS